MKRLLQLSTLYLLLITISACGLTERITRNRSVKVDTVYKTIPIPEHDFTNVFALRDSLYFEDERLALSLRRLNAFTADIDTIHGQTEIGAQERNLWRIDATVKPDTVVVPCEEKTITDRTETTRYVRRTPGYIKFIIGGLLTLLILAGCILYFTRR